MGDGVNDAPALAGAAIVVLVTLDLLGKLSLPLGVADHEGSTVIVALNGLRLLHDRSWRGSTETGSERGAGSRVQAI